MGLIGLEVAVFYVTDRDVELLIDGEGLMGGVPLVVAGEGLIVVEGVGDGVAECEW